MRKPTKTQLRAIQEILDTFDFTTVAKVMKMMKRRIFGETPSIPDLKSFVEENLLSLAGDPKSVETQTACFIFQKWPRGFNVLYVVTELMSEEAFYEQLKKSTIRVK